MGKTSLKHCPSHSKNAFGTASRTQLLDRKLLACTKPSPERPVQRVLSWQLQQPHPT